MNRARIGAGAIVMLAWTWGAIEACTATSTVDKARESRDTDEYKAAKDVATEMIDQEKFSTDEVVIESGTGVLLVEKTWYGLQVSNDGKSKADWEKVLDQDSARGHGISESGKFLGDGYAGTPKVRDHMRMHIKEWDDALKGTDPQGLMEWLKNGGYNAQPVSQDHAG